MDTCLLQMHLCRLNWCTVLDAPAVSALSHLLAEHLFANTSQHKLAQQRPAPQIPNAMWHILTGTG